MLNKAYVPVFSLTLLLSAALLFSVQPLFSKMILPLLGGTPQVWNTAMLFFQVCLLGGYAYAHATSKYLSVRMQSTIHLTLLVLFAFVLPLGIPEGTFPPFDKDPTLWQLNLMLIVVGGPFFVLAASAPMFQRWFAASAHKDANDPYFLYAASNLGSLASLFAYPLVLEPFFDLYQQSDIWMYGYIALGAFAFVCVVLSWKSVREDKVSNLDKRTEQKIIETPSHKTRFMWILLAFVPSSLMLGVTTYLTTDVASVPLLWIVPLALYVGTFVLVFARKPLFKRDHIMIVHGFVLILMLAQLMIFGGVVQAWLLPFHLFAFFVIALSCHTELASMRPHSKHLTEFYLMMSLGGALGGFFNAIIAPQFFTLPIEYGLVLGFSAFLRYASKSQLKMLNKKILWVVATIIILVIISYYINTPMLVLFKKLFAYFFLVSCFFFITKRTAFAIICFVSFIFYMPGTLPNESWIVENHFRTRNFFGIINVIDTADGERIALHGTTNHGTQYLVQDMELEKTSYYGPKSPLSDVFKYLDKKTENHIVAVTGLGVGVTACYTHPNRYFDFYEIDLDMIKIAENPELFTFLSNCGSQYSIILGDARLTISKQPDQKYDFILNDVYSSDNIPIHLITKEAIELYVTKLKPDGVLTFHISNKHLDIEPVLANIAKELGLKAYAKVSLHERVKDTNFFYVPSHFITFAFDDDFEEYLVGNNWEPVIVNESVGVWTDSYSNILSVLGASTFAQRSEILHEQNKSGQK